MLKLINKPSKHWNERKNRAKPEMIVIHHTGKTSMEEVFAAFSDSDVEISAHYLIDRRGTIYQLVDESKRAYHAGGSVWTTNDGKHYANDALDGDINSRSIGIELFGRMEWEYTEAQINSLKWLCKDIMDRHDISARNVLGHSDINPLRKWDPGHLFPWKDLAKEGIGVWPNKEGIIDTFNEAAGIARNERLVTSFLKEVGYNTKSCGEVVGLGRITKTEAPSFKQLVTAFQRHYEPEVFNKDGSGEGVGIPTENTVIKLFALGSDKIIPVEEPKIEICSDIKKHVSSFKAF